MQRKHMIAAILAVVALGMIFICVNADEYSADGPDTVTYHVNVTETERPINLILFCIISAQNCCAAILICYKIFCCSQIPSKWLSKWTRLSCIPLMKQIKRIPLTKWHAVSKPISFRLII